VLAVLETAEPNPRRRGEMASGLRTVCAVLRHNPHELPADTALLGRLIRKAVPAAAGVSPSRWTNARSLLQAALRRSGLAIMPGRRLHPLAPAWAALAAKPQDGRMTATQRLYVALPVSSQLTSLPSTISRSAFVAASPARVSHSGAAMPSNRIVSASARIFSRAYWVRKNRPKDSSPCCCDRG
jgi:hypothetical protein